MHSYTICDIMRRIFAGINTHGIELVDCCDEFAHLVSDDTGQVDKRTLYHACHVCVGGGGEGEPGTREEYVMYICSQ